jgi:hypothetical protein
LVTVSGLFEGRKDLVDPDVRAPGLVTVDVRETEAAVEPS